MRRWRHEIACDVTSCKSSPPPFAMLFPPPFQQTDPRRQACCIQQDKPSIGFVKLISIQPMPPTQTALLQGSPPPLVEEVRPPPSPLMMERGAASFGLERKRQMPVG